MVSQRMKQLGSAPSVIRELVEYGERRAARVGRENVLDFAVGDRSASPPPQVNETAVRLLQSQDAVTLHGYTSAQGAADVRARIADGLNARFSAGAGPDDLYMTCGATAALCCALHALAAGNGGTFAAVAPCAPEYQVFIEGAGCSMTLVQPDPHTLQIDPAALEAAIGPDTRGVVVNSPNDPSGVIYTEAVLRETAALLERKSAQYGHPVYLIVDESCRGAVFEGRSVPWAPSLYRDAILCCSFSNSLSLPGERIGYVLVSPTATDHDDLCAAVAGAGRALGYVCAPSLFQRVAAECCGLTADTSACARSAGLLTSSLRELGYMCVEPQGGYHLLMRSPEPDDGAFCERAKERDLLLVPGSCFGLPGWVRLALCVQSETIERALPIFRELVKHGK